jgi:DNA-binding MarR family transcriptional regulator
MTTPASGFPWPGPEPGDPGQPPSPGELLDAWACVVRGYTHVMQVLTERVERETRLAAPSFFVLAWLLRSGNQAVPLSMLARQVAFSSGGFTKMADRLEQAGLIERQPCPDDRRVTNAVLTPVGRAHAERAVAVYCAGLRDLVLRHLGPDGLRSMAGQMSLLSGDPAPAGWPADQDVEGSGPARPAGVSPARLAGSGPPGQQAQA